MTRIFAAHSYYMEPNEYILIRRKSCRELVECRQELISVQELENAPYTLTESESIALIRCRDKLRGHQAKLSALLGSSHNIQVIKNLNAMVYTEYLDAQDHTLPQRVAEATNYRDLLTPLTRFYRHCLFAQAEDTYALIAALIRVLEAHETEIKRDEDEPLRMGTDTNFATQLCSITYLYRTVCNEPNIVTFNETHYLMFFDQPDDALGIRNYRLLVDHARTLARRRVINRINMHVFQRLCTIHSKLQKTIAEPSSNHTRDRPRTQPI